MCRILHDIACSLGELMMPNYDNINLIGVLVLFTILLFPCLRDNYDIPDYGPRTDICLNLI